MPVGGVGFFQGSLMAFLAYNSSKFTMVHPATVGINCSTSPNRYTEMEGCSGMLLTKRMTKCITLPPKTPL